MIFVRHLRSLATLAAAASLVLTVPAQAGEGLFGFVYTLDLQPKGKFELEQRVDVTHRQAVGTYDLGQYRTEIEYGVSNDLQLGALRQRVLDSCRAQLSQPRDVPEPGAVHRGLRRPRARRTTRTPTTAPRSTVDRSKPSGA